MLDRTLAHSEWKKANCHYCGYLCGLKARVKNNKILEIKPDPSRYPYDESIINSCRRWKLNIADIDSPKRINYPLKRLGEKGSNQWEQITWDQAIEEIGNKLKNLIGDYGGKTVSSMIGGPHTAYWPLHKFMNLIGSPNNMGIGQICWNPRIWAETITYGWTIEADIQSNLTECLIIWGTNPAQSDNSAFWRYLLSLSKTDMNIVVIDPRKTQTASKANTWLAIKPGTDVFLALSMIHVIIEEKLYDRNFVEAWTKGFDELKIRVSSYKPEDVEVICGISAGAIKKLARDFASARVACILSGRGVDQVGKNVLPGHRAICILRALTGNVDKPGACVINDASDFTSEFLLERSDLLSQEQIDACLNTDFTPLQSYRGHALITQDTKQISERVLPMRYMTSAHPDLVFKAILEHDPYPITAMIINATNPLYTFADSKKVLEALKKLELLVSLEFVMTPSSTLADYVLPVASSLERTTFQAHGGVANMVYGGLGAVDPYYERKDEYSIFKLLGEKLGQSQYWQESSFEEVIDNAFKEANYSLNQYAQVGQYMGTKKYFKHIARKKEGYEHGFSTQSGKIELTSEHLKALSNSTAPELETLSLKNDELILITGARKQPYNASMYQDVDSFRKVYPNPTAELSLKTARKHGVQEGDWISVFVTEAPDKIGKFKVNIIDMINDVISVDYAWWNPDKNIGAPDYGGLYDSNINILTSSSLDTGEKMIGTWKYNNIICKINKIKVGEHNG